MTAKLPPNIEASSVCTLDRYVYEDEEHKDDTLKLERAASVFLSSFAWCEKIEELLVGISLGGVIGVFLAHVEPATADVDQWLWVVVGDVPPAYLVTYACSTPDAALNAYVGEMLAWVEAVQHGTPLDGVIPVNAPTTQANADALRSRLEFIVTEVLESDREVP